MQLRVLTDETRRQAALADLERALATWAGGRAEAWPGRDGMAVAFAPERPIYLFLEQGSRPALGAARHAGDDTLFCGEPGGTAWPLALRSDGAVFLLADEADLERQGLADPLRRLAGAPLTFGAERAGRRFLAIGPLDDPRCGEAFSALAGLAPQAASDGSALYRVSAAVKGQRRARDKALGALAQRFRAAGCELSLCPPAGLDLVARRGSVAVAAALAADAREPTLMRLAGALALSAPRASGLRRCLALPAPEAPVGSAFARFGAGLAELGALVAFYDFRAAEPVFWAHAAPDDTPPELRRLFA